MVMKVLMFGWEFPPMKSGGLGTACYDLCRGLTDQGVEVTFVVPKLPKGMQSKYAKLVGANQQVKIREVDSILTPYMHAKSYEETYEYLDSSMKDNYGKDLMAEVDRYTRAAALIARKENFDVIHAHDWMTYEAGLIAKQHSGKPLVAHMHATEFDRTGGNPNYEISHREYLGMNGADMIIANSEFTRNNVLNNYSIDADKLRVVHWGIDPENPHYEIGEKSPFKDEKIVLFVGRVTLQKGPDYFVKLAQKVSEFEPNTKFVLAGNGDMLPKVIEQVADLGMSDKFVFPGFLKGEDVHRAFQMADLYVMPSVSEPFGLVALESVKNGTPVLLSKQSGVSEVLSNCFKVDFWNIEDMANKVVSFLRYPELAQTMGENIRAEGEKFNLIEPANKCIDCYKEVLTW